MGTLAPLRIAAAFSVHNAAAAAAIVDNINVNAVFVVVCPFSPRIGLQTRLLTFFNCCCTTMGKYFLYRTSSFRQYCYALALAAHNFSDVPFLYFRGRKERGERQFRCCSRKYLLMEIRQTFGDITGEKN